MPNILRLFLCFKGFFTTKNKSDFHLYLTVPTYIMSTACVVKRHTCMAHHIWSESNLVSFEIPEGLNIVLGSSWPLYCESRMELDLAKNVPFQKFQ